MHKYQTIAGDTFELVAFKTLGASRHVETLINANRNHIDTFIFKAGVELTAPDIDTTKKTKLPPWRRE